MNADAAETRALDLAEELRDVLDDVKVPSEGLIDWLPERLSFLLARDNYAQCLAAVRNEQDISAGSLARALFEEAMRWSWVDEDLPTRRTAFLGAAARRHRQVDQAGRELGIEPNDYYGPWVTQILCAAEGSAQFPRQIEGQLEWGLGNLSKMLYTQYRLFSQYTHSSLLAIASSVETHDGELSVGRLPQVARLTALRNAVANMAVITDCCKSGLIYRRAPSDPAINFLAMGYASNIAELLQPFAPATD